MECCPTWPASLLQGVFTDPRRLRGFIKLCRLAWSGWDCYGTVTTTTTMTIYRVRITCRNGFWDRNHLESTNKKTNSKQQIHNTSYKQQPTQPGRTANTTGRTAANTTNPEHQLKKTANTTGITTNESVETTEQLWLPSLFSSPTRLDCSPSVCLSCCLFFCRNGNRMPKLIITNRYRHSTRSNTHSQ